MITLTWEKLVISHGNRGLKLGEFSVRSLTTMKTPEHLVEKNYNWYFDKESKILKAEIAKDGLKIFRTQITIPQKVKDALKEDQCIVFVEDNALYFGSYKLGQENLEKILRRDKVKF